MQETTMVHHPWPGAACQILRVAVGQAGFRKTAFRLSPIRTLTGYHLVWSFGGVCWKTLEMDLSASAIVIGHLIRAHNMIEDIHCPPQRLISAQERLLLHTLVWQQHPSRQVVEQAQGPGLCVCPAVQEAVLEVLGCPVSQVRANDTSRPLLAGTSSAEHRVNRYACTAGRAGSGPPLPERIQIPRHQRN